MTNPSLQSERASGRVTVAVLMNPCVAAAGKAPVSYGEEYQSHGVTNRYLPNPRTLLVQQGWLAGCRASLVMEWDDFI